MLVNITSVPGLQFWNGTDVMLKQFFVLTTMSLLKYIFSQMFSQ
jgi:hypothetical protein